MQRISISDEQVQPTTDGRGNGAFATCKIARGAYIGQYEGQLLNEAQYWKRYPSGVVRKILKHLPRNRCTY